MAADQREGEMELVSSDVADIPQVRREPSEGEREMDGGAGLMNRSRCICYAAQ